MMPKDTLERKCVELKERLQREYSLSQSVKVSLAMGGEPPLWKRRRLAELENARIRYKLRKENQAR